MIMITVFKMFGRCANDLHRMNVISSCDMKFQRMNAKLRRIFFSNVKRFWFVSGKRWSTLFKEQLGHLERGPAHGLLLFFFFDLLLDLPEIDHGVDRHQQDAELDEELAEDRVVLSVVRDFVVPEVELDDFAEAAVEPDVDVVEEGEPAVSGAYFWKKST